MEQKKSVCLTILKQDIHHKTGFIVTNVKYNTRTSFPEESKESALKEYRKQCKLNRIPVEKKFNH